MTKTPPMNQDINGKLDIIFSKTLEEMLKNNHKIMMKYLLVNIMKVKVSSGKLCNEFKIKILKLENRIYRFLMRE